MWPRDPGAATESLGAGRALPRVEKLTSLSAWCSLFIDGLTLESITSKTAVSGGAWLFEKIFIFCFAVDLEILKVLAGAAGTWDDSERQETCSRKELAGGGGGVSPEAFTHPPTHSPHIGPETARAQRVRYPRLLSGDTGPGRTRRFSDHLGKVSSRVVGRQRHRIL